MYQCILYPTKSPALFNLTAFMFLMLGHIVPITTVWAICLFSSLVLAGYAVHLVDEKLSDGKKRFSAARLIGLMLLIVIGMSLLGGPHFHE